jgi:flagellar hook-basal body complex protein FliE
MKKIAVLLMIGVIAFGGGLMGCQEKKPAERLKNALEDAADAAGDIIKDAAKKVGETTQTTGEKTVKDITDDAGKAINDVFDNMKDKLKK